MLGLCTWRGEHRYQTRQRGAVKVLPNCHHILVIRCQSGNWEQAASWHLLFSYKRIVCLDGPNILSTTCAYTGYHKWKTWRSKNSVLLLRLSFPSFDYCSIDGNIQRHDWSFWKGYSFLCFPSVVVQRLHIHVSLGLLACCDTHRRFQSKRTLGFESIIHHSHRLCGDQSIKSRTSRSSPNDFDRNPYSLLEQDVNMKWLKQTKGRRPRKFLVRFSFRKSAISWNVEHSTLIRFLRQKIADILLH